MSVMITGLVLFLGIHLAGMILFGSFFAYSIVDLVSAISRGAKMRFVPVWKHGVIAVVSGVVLACLTIYFHPTLFGTGPVA